MATLFGRAASSLIAAIAGEEQQPAAAVAEASVGLEFPLSSANDNKSEVGEQPKERFSSANRSDSLSGIIVAIGGEESFMREEFQHSSVASANGTESEVGEKPKESFLSANGSESEDSMMSEELFPCDDEMALVPVHPMIDNGLYEKILYCQPNNMTNDEKNYTNEQILEMSVNETRSLCKKCEYFESGKNKSKKVSTSGPLPGVKSRLLAWYHIFRQEQAGGNERAFSFSTSWTPSQDARLLEIMSSPTYQKQLRFIHHAAPRGVLDAADGSPMVSVWREVVAVLYNNFQSYQPPYRFPHDLTLKAFNPNNDRIPRRTPELLKNRYANLRSLLTVKYRQSNKSGNHEPQDDEFESKLDLGNPLHQSVLYWWRILIANGDTAILQRHVKLIPCGAGIDTSDPQSISRSLAAASTKVLHPRMDNGKGGSTTDHILKALDGLETKFNALDDEKENMYWEHANIKVLLDSRDKAQEKLERLGDEIRGLEQGNTKKRKRLISHYKRSRREYVLFEHQLSQAMGIELDPDIEKDDASFLEEEDD